MKKKFVKMNVDDKELSLGNFCRLLKGLAVNKSAALQVEVFSCLFDVDSIQDTTVNNYCIGLRSIGDEYKQKYLILKKKYNKDKFIMINICLRIVSILDGNLYFNIGNKDGYLLINSSKKIKEFCLKLYNIAKNDTSVSLEVSDSIYSKICDGNLYEALVYILFYIILEKKQPVYEEDKKKDVIENLLAQSKISSSDLEEYLKLKFCEGSNYYLSLKKLANNENAYACFELGCLEYEGNIFGVPRYDIAYSYFLKATKMDHPSSYYYIGRIYFNGNIGSGKAEEKKLSFDYFKRASELGCISAFNSLGLFYLKGIYPVEKDVDTAIKYFKKASGNNYVYAFNNLGLIEEKRKNYSMAFEYFKKSADLGESWACNRVGEYYRKGIYVDKSMVDAFNYYNKGLDVPKLYLCFYNFYNLARYYYLEGCLDIVISPDKNKAIKYLIVASDNGIIDANILLFYYYIECYLKNKDSSKLAYVYEYKKKIETNSQYNNTIKREIENALKKISTHNDIDITLII